VADANELVVVSALSTLGGAVIGSAVQAAFVARRDRRAAGQKELDELRRKIDALETRVAILDDRSDQPRRKP
jgi:cell division protein FtsB